MSLDMSKIRLFSWEWGWEDRWRKFKMLYDVIFYLFNILSSFCWGLHEYQPMLLCKLLAFLRAYCPSMSKITLVANQHNCHICICMLPCIFQPASQVIKCLPPIGKHISTSFISLFKVKKTPYIQPESMDVPNWHVYFVA